MMELGATICTPRSPQCLVCPVITWCATRGTEDTKPQAARYRKQVHYALARKGDSILLVQRPTDANAWPGCGSFPKLSLPRQSHWQSFATPSPTLIMKSRLCPLRRDCVRDLNSDARWFTRKQWQKLALTGLTRKVLRKLAPAT